MKKSVGRPAKRPEDRVRTTQRQFGRVPDEEWAELQKAAKGCGLSFTQWALAILLTMARKQNKAAAKINGTK